MDVLQILVFAALAVFLGWRLYNLLGKPSGRSPEEHAREAQEARANAPAPARSADDAAERPAAAAKAAYYSGPAGDGLARIAETDRNFDPETFVKGARQAYKMVVEAYAKGDKETLDFLLAPRVYEAYARSIEAREEKNHTQITELERLRESEIVEASLNQDKAKIKVRFTAELATETRDSNDERVSGDLTRLKTVTEIWSFERDVASNDPNWKLSAVKPV